MSSTAATIPVGSRVLVTGATGFLASHVITQFLERGYKVRGTVRDLNQASWLMKGSLKSYADSGALELAAVPDLAADGAYDEAVKGVSAITHIAYVTKIVPDPNKVITPSVNGIKAIIGAASKEPSVKEVVFTSSALCTSPFIQKEDNGIIGRSSWNEDALRAAWAPPPYGMSHAMANYPASKVAAEKEVWRSVEEDKLHFTVNVVSPAGLIGEPLHKKHVEGQANWVTHAYRGNKAMMDPMPASFYLDVKNVAAVHVAAILDPNVQNARLQVWGHAAHWNEVLAVLRKRRPQENFVEDYPESYHLQVSLDQSDATSLLKKWSGKDGWTSLEDSIVASIENPYFDDGVKAT